MSGIANGGYQMHNHPKNNEHNDTTFPTGFHAVKIQ
jgi:hypothetical protein